VAQLRPRDQLQKLKNTRPQNKGSRPTPAAINQPAHTQA